MQPLNLSEFESAARERLPAMVFDYYVGGSDDEVSLQNNRKAYQKLHLYPRMLTDVSQRNLSTTVLGEQVAAPILIAPTGFAAMAHPSGEIAIAEAASNLGIGMTLSTMSNYSLEDVAAVARVPLWFQLYVYRDRAVTRALVERAEAVGYKALVLTVDTPILGRREKDIRNHFHLPPHLTAKNFVEGSGMEQISQDSLTSGLLMYILSLWDASLSWKDVEWLATITRMPILLKGILRPDDAVKAIEHGAAGVIVSNHGGRQLDTAVAPIDTLPSVSQALDNRGEVYVDGGVRRGTDVLKAIALGAKAVLVGRPILWGLALDGQTGVERVLTLLRDEFDVAMALCGCRSIAEITPDLVAYPK